MARINPNEANGAIEELEKMIYDTENVYQRSAIGTAISALERYIPENVVQEDGQFFTGKCPECGHMIARGTDYCTKCAQAVNWAKEWTE